ncbi:MAG: alpha/beta hydrolase [Nitrospinaceae bacterium]
MVGRVSVYSLFLFCRFLVRSISKLILPKLFLHGTSDEIVLYDLGRKLFDQAAEVKTFCLIEGAGHNDTYIIGERGYLKALNRFVTETLKNFNNRG